jgi:hypothetical protein
MVIVDSSVWLDYFNGREIPEVVKLDRLLETELLGVAVIGIAIGLNHHFIGD